MTHHRLETILRHVRGLGGDPVADLPDVELLRRFAAAGDEAAFAEIVRRHGPMILGVCRRLLGDVHLTEDSFQATFLLLARKARWLRRPDRLGPWLYGVARRVALKARAKAAGRREVAAVDLPIPAAAETDDLRPVLDDAIARLPARYRLPVVLCYFQGLTNAEAADRLRCPPGTVATRLSRARERLRVLLLRRGVVPAAGALTAALTADAAGAVVPDDLLLRTARWAAAWAAGSAAPIPTPILTLTREVVQTMIFDKLKPVALLAVLGVVGLGAGVALSRPTLAEAPDKPAKPPVAKFDPAKPTPAAERPLSLALLRQKPPDAYRVEAGDVLGLFIEGILGAHGQIPPIINLASPPGSGLPPTVGFPVAVDEAGMLSLPFLDPLNVRGKTINEIKNAIAKAYTESRIVAPGAKVLVALAKPRSYRVTVVRSPEFLDANGTVTLDLPAYENDVLAAVAKAGGLTRVPQNAVIVIHRGSDSAGKEIRIPTRIRPGQPMPFKPDDVILRNGDVITFEEGAVPPEVFATRAVATQDGNLLVQRPGGEWKEYDRTFFRANELDGRSIDNPVDRLKTMTPVLLVLQGQRPTAGQLQSAKPGTVVLTTR
jgi:RNA polymerase sigma factor (sigma-70 family)